MSIRTPGLRKLAASLSVIGALALLAEPQAQATAKHIVHGSGCSFEFNPPPFGARKGVKGVMHEDVTVSHNATCALERSNTSNTNGLLDLEVRINQIQNQHTTINCTAFSMRTDGSFVKIVTKDSEGVAKKVDFGSSLNLSSSGGSYMVTCLLSAYDALQSVYSSEP